MTSDNQRLAFDAVAEIYDRARMRYPAQLFDDLFAYLGIEGGAVRAVEIGPGTGQATEPLLVRGATVTAVEIGPRLAAYLSGKLAGRRIEVVNAAFEDARLPEGAFDLVLSANAWHWVEASVRLVKARRLLRPGGALALIGANQIRSEADRGYFDRTFSIYKRYRPDEQQVESPGEDVVPPEYHEVESSGRFEDVRLLRYRSDQTYETAAYADLVRSYSNTQTMEPAPREALIADLCEVIDREYGGVVVRPIVVTLTIGRRAAGDPGRL